MVHGALRRVSAIEYKYVAKIHAYLAILTELQILQLSGRVYIVHII